MAIIIPSSKTYDRQNPKVRDNVIERIEVGAVEVLPNNEYETPVYNETLTLNGEFSYSNSGGDTQTDNSSFADAFPVVACGTIIYDKYVKAIIKIKKTAKNKYITKIYNQNREGSNTPYTQIAKNFEEKSYYYQVNDSYIYTDGLNSNFDFEKIKSYSSQKENLSNQTISGLRDLIVRFSANDENGDDYDNRFVANWATPTITAEGTNDIVSVIIAKIYGGSYSKNSITNFSTSETNLGELNIDDSDNDYITIIIPKVFIGRTIYATSTAIYTYAQASHSNFYPSKVVEIQQNVVRAEITFYGNTIGIDLTDKTVYINEEKAKKVHSVDGNELMQTSNYYQSTDTNAIKIAFTNTLSDYANGKETATIRCSISDYYEYDSGDKVIWIDNSTEKMSFKIGDQVIPMVYGADGKDHPMSLYKNGNPKVFQVIGTKIYYDGAVWQELSLQEC